MKWYSPFLFFALLLFGCDKSTKPDWTHEKNGSAVARLMDATNNTRLTAAERFTALDKADTLASGNSILENIVANNRLYITISAFPDSLSTAMPAFKKIEADTSDNPYKAYYQSSIANYLLSRQQVDSAFQFYMKAKNEALLHNDSLRAGYCLIRTAELWQVYNEYHESEGDAVVALQLLKNQKNSEYLAEVYNTLGISYTSLKDFPNAIMSYNKASSLAITELQKQILQNNIGSVYARDGQFDKAIAIFRMLLESKVIAEDQSSKARVLDNLGYAFFKKDLSGLDEMLTAMKIREGLSEKSEMASSALHLHDYYLWHGNPSKAMNYAHHALVCATAVNATNDRLTAMEYIAGLSNGPEEKAVSAMHRALSDSIAEVRSGMTTRFSKAKYDLKLTTDLANANAKNATLAQQNKMIILYCGIAAIVLIIIFFYYKIKKEKQFFTYKAEMRLAKKIHDELANDVFSTMSFAENEDLSEAENKETLLNNLDNIYYRTRDISRDLSTIDTGPAYPQRLRELMSGYQSGAVKIIAVGLDTIVWDKIAIGKKIVLYRVLQEWLTNMKKHSGCSRVILTFKMEKSRIMVVYNDDGIGLPAETAAAKKMMEDTENRIIPVSGKYTFTPSDKGLKVSLSIPL